MAMVFDSALPKTEKIVLLAMADYASDSGESIFPSVGTLARKTSLADRSVQRTITDLINYGYLMKVKTGGGRSTNRYSINIEKFRGDGVSPLIRQADTAGVTDGHRRGGGVSPETSINHQLTKEDVLKPADETMQDVGVIITDYDPETKMFTYEPCDDDGLPVKPKKKRSEKQVINDEKVEPIAEALAEVCGMSLQIDAKRIYAEANRLIRDPRISADLIRVIYSKGGAWFKSDWRGKQGSKPKISQIAETIFTFDDPVDSNTIKGDFLQR
jgi:hypothetical protein